MQIKMNDSSIIETAHYTDFLYLVLNTKKQKLFFTEDM